MAEQQLESVDTAEAFAEYVMTTPGPDGSPNTNEQWITKGQVMDFWDMGVATTRQALEARNEDVDPDEEKTMAAWWASAAIQGFIVAKSQDNG